MATQATFAALRQGLADALATVPGIGETYPFIPDGLSPPCAFVLGPEITYDQTFARGIDFVQVIVRVLTNRVAESSAQDALDAMLSGSGEYSVKAAIEADRTLGGAVQGCRVARSENYGAFAIGPGGGDVQYLGVDFVVEVYC